LSTFAFVFKEKAKVGEEDYGGEEPMDYEEEAPPPLLWIGEKLMKAN